MATFNADRPAFSFSGQADLDLVTTTAALANTPADFLSMDSGGVDLAASSVTTTNHADDDLGCEIRIMNGATVLAAADAGGTWVTLAPTTGGPTSSISTNVIDFAYVNTTANKATWDGASVEYRQRYVKLKGSDTCYVSSSAITNNITFTYTGDTVDNLTARDIESDSEFTTPTATHPWNDLPTPTDIESASEFTTPALFTEDDCLADNIESASQVTTPNITEGTSTKDLLADNIESTTNVSTPAATHIHVLTATEIESASELTTPAMVVVRNLLADEIESASEFTTPALFTEDDLLADNIEAASEVSTPTFGQLVFIPAAIEVESASELSTPTLVHIYAFTATDVESASEFTTPAISEDNTLAATDVESASEFTTPAVGQGYNLAATDVESASEFTTPTIGADAALAATDIEAAAQLSTPALTTVYALSADDIEAASEIPAGVASENSDTIRPDADISVGDWTTHTGATTNLFQQIDEETPDDGDYIRSELNPVNSAVRFSLSNLADAHNIAGRHIVRYRYGKDIADSQQIDVTVRLIEVPGSTIATWTHTNVGVTLTTAEQFLTSGEKASITDYDNLFLEFQANAP